MILSLTNDRIVSVEAFKGKVWVSLRAKGGGITVELSDEEAFEVAGSLIAGVRKNRKA